MALTADDLLAGGNVKHDVVIPAELLNHNGEASLDSQVVLPDY